MVLRGAGGGGAGGRSAIKLVPWGRDSEEWQRFNNSIPMEIWFLGLGLPNYLAFHGSMYILSTLCLLA